MTGALLGHLGILIHTPELGRAGLAFETALQALPGLSETSKRIASLVVASHERAGYAIYAQRRLAVDRGSLSQDQVDDILAGRTPGSFGRAEEAAQMLATELCHQRGSLDSQTWQTAVAVLGKDQAVALVHCVGFHQYIAIILNAFDAQFPASGVDEERLVE